VTRKQDSAKVRITAEDLKQVLAEDRDLQKRIVEEVLQQGEFSGAGAVADGGSGSVCAFGVPSLDRLLNTAYLRRHGSHDPEGSAVRLRPLTTKLASLHRTRGLARRGRNYRLCDVEEFLPRFEEGTGDPICDNDADPTSLARRITDGLNQGQFRVL